MKKLGTALALQAMLVFPAAARAQGAATLPSFSHVYIIVMENHEFSDIIRSPDAPYINQLAQQYALGTAYTAVTHPSLPNYMALTGGETVFADDCIG
jgi:acid phosphatase